MFVDLIRFQYPTFHAATDRGKCPTETLVEVMAVQDAARRGVDNPPVERLAGRSR